MFTNHNTSTTTKHQNFGTIIRKYVVISNSFSGCLTLIVDNKLNTLYKSIIYLGWILHNTTQHKDTNENKYIIN